MVRAGQLAINLDYGQNTLDYTECFGGWPTLCGLCKGWGFPNRNTEKRGVVPEPELWEWSSYRSYAFQEEGRVKIHQWTKAVMKVRDVA